MDFGTKLKMLREQRDLTQEDLANELYVSRTAVSKWETNKGYPSIDVLKEISQYFNVPIDDLLGDFDLDLSKEHRQKQSKKLYWLAIGCFSLAVIFTAASVWVYGNGFVEWMLPLRLCGVMSVIGYIILAAMATRLYRTPEQNRVNWKRIMISRYVLAVIVGAVLMGVIVGLG